MPTLLGDWRDGLLAWGIIAAVLILPWVFLIGHDSRGGFVSHGHISFPRMLRSRLAWAMAVFFALQSMQAYAAMGWLPAILIDLGNTEAMAGVVLGIAAFMGIRSACCSPAS